MHRSLQWTLDAITAGPAFVRNGRMDVLATNRLARAFYRDLYAAPGNQANLARFQFLDPASRRFYPDWDRFADVAVAILRTEAGRNPYDKDLHDLVGELSTRSEEFRTRWRPRRPPPRHRNETLPPRDRRRGHPRLEGLEPAAEPGLTSPSTPPSPARRPSEGLRLLASWAATQRRPAAARAAHDLTDDRPRHPAPGDADRVTLLPGVRSGASAPGPLRSRRADAARPPTAPRGREAGPSGTGWCCHEPAVRHSRGAGSARARGGAGVRADGDHVDESGECGGGDRDQAERDERCPRRRARPAGGMRPPKANSRQAQEGTTPYRRCRDGPTGRAMWPAVPAGGHAADQRGTVRRSHGGQRQPKCRGVTRTPPAPTRHIRSRSAACAFCAQRPARRPAPKPHSMNRASSAPNANE